MKLRFCAAGAVALALATGGAAASAATAVTFTDYQFTLNPGETLIDNFDSPIAAGYVLGGTGTILMGNSASGAAPATSATTADATQFLSELRGQFSTLSTPSPLREISFYVGSLDPYNSISFTGPGGFSQTFTGNQLIAATVAADLDNGNQTSGNTNGRYTFVFSQPVTGVRLDSSSNSFEVSNIAAITALIPEPATWALMIIGFGGVGAMMRRRTAASA